MFYGATVEAFYIEPEEREKIEKEKEDEIEDLTLEIANTRSVSPQTKDEVLNEKDLPIKYAGFSPCFRKEAGAAGRDTRGIVRIHQFNKVEQYIYCTPEQSDEMHEHLLNNLCEIMEDLERNPKYKESKLVAPLGRDVMGRVRCVEINKTPHLLVAGSTGSGKSVCINTIITSLLYKATPEEVKLILIDPKVVELGNYNGVPHLMIPVVTEPSKAAAALNWAVAEMTDRYKKFAERGVRDLQSYNDSVRAELEEDKVLPQVVIIIDELADLMMAAPSQI